MFIYLYFFEIKSKKDVPENDESRTKKPVNFHFKKGVTGTNPEKSNIKNTFLIEEKLQKAEDEVRYHIKRKLIIGNSCKWIDPSKTKDGQGCYQWLVYLRSDEAEPSTYIKKVRYFLHPTYKPNDVIDVLEPPFQLTRLGYAEFSIKAQLHFVNPLNKPFDVHHRIVLDNTKSGIQMFGAETTAVIHLAKEKEYSQQEVYNFFYFIFFLFLFYSIFYLYFINFILFFLFYFTNRNQLSELIYPINVETIHIVENNVNNPNFPFPEVIARYLSIAVSFHPIINPSPNKNQSKNKK